MNILKEQLINKALNDYEFKRKKLVLCSKPRNITLGTHYRCNTKCVFCFGGNYPSFSFKTYKKFFEPKLISVLQSADKVGFHGYGEVLLIPEIEKFLSYTNKTLPYQTKSFITNGVPLKKEIIIKLSEGRYAITISLHATDPQLHHRLTGLSNFDLILKNIKNLVKIRAKWNHSLEINFAFLATIMNIDNLVDFVRLTSQLGVRRIGVNYLTIFSSEHIKLSCFFAKARTNDFFFVAEEEARKLGITLLLPPKFNHNYVSKKSRDYIIPCRNPWNYFYVELQGSVLPCCFAGEHIGYLNKNSFEEIWNGESYRKLRERLVNGKPYSWCNCCYAYNPTNVNKFSSHVTFRPVLRRKILEIYEQNFKGKTR